MAFENFPASLQPIFQQNMLDRRFLAQLGALNAYRKSTYRLPVEKRNGETMIYSRAGRISPVLDDIVPSNNVAPDNGFANVGGVGSAAPTYPFEQFPVTIGMREYYLDLNLIQEQEVIANLFKQNVDNLAENVALSLDLYAMYTAFVAYMSGQTHCTTTVTGSAGTTNVHVDNIKGFDTQYATVSIPVSSGGTATFRYGLPTAVTSSNKMPITIYPAAGGAAVVANVQLATADGSNATTMDPRIGVSGTLQLDQALTVTQGDVLVAGDAPAVFRPNGKLSHFALQSTDTMGAQLIINAVAELRANGVKPPLSNGTYPCYIDPVVDAQFFTDSQYQIMSQGQFQSPDFKNGRVSQNFGVTFVPTTNAPSFAFTSSDSESLVARHCLITGEKYVQESPFEGTFDAVRSMPDMGVVDYRIADDVVLVNRMPLDRAGQIMSQGWYWIGGFCVPTDVTITKQVVPSASAARYKRAAVVQVASKR